MFTIALVVAESLTPSVGRLRLYDRIPMENVVWSERNFSLNAAAYVFEVNGNPKVALLLRDSSDGRVVTRMVYDVSDHQDTMTYFPTFRSLIHKHVKQIDLTHLPHDERVQFLTF